VEETKSSAPSLAVYRAGLSEPLRPTTVCLLTRPGKVLLAMKKRGFGVGKWNGLGGKPHPGEAIVETAVREAREEAGVTPRDLRHVATLSFYFPHVPSDAGWEQMVYAYRCAEWAGDPVETEEMAPRWFAVDAIPFAAMWPDAALWLPRVLRGEVFTGHFLYDAEQRVREWEIVAGLAE
jgi:8-oxo-dGTP pyrophosphatase MutT (NUDIX family)